LGSGSNGKLFEVLRLQHGYTYGAYSEFSHYKNGGLFTAYSSVQSTVTKESVDLFKNTFDTFGPNYTAEQLESVKDAMIRANAGRFENLNSLVYMLNNIEQNNLPDDYILREEAIVKNTTLEQIKAAAEEYLNSDKMIVVVTGDKAQLKNLKGAKIYKIQ
jgi:zinc protease